MHFFRARGIASLLVFAAQRIDCRLVVFGRFEAVAAMALDLDLVKLAIDLGDPLA